MNHESWRCGWERRCWEIGVAGFGDAAVGMDVPRKTPCEGTVGAGVLKKLCWEIMEAIVLYLWEWVC